jgi:CRP-like cAMP-binding protein
LDEGDISLKDHDLIDDNFQEDWENVFIRSKLAANLSNSIIHRLMSRLTNVEVQAGQLIVKSQSPGDYFYVIKQGQAIVKTDPKGPFKGEQFSLKAGNYFGDEALVAETTRNATVTMETDGVLGRLDHAAFNELIKQYLVSPLSKEIQLTQQVKLLDVRFPVEYRLGHADGSTNMPISLLRRQLHEMKQSLLYVIAPANDRRAELATYLMRQAGYQAYHLPHTETTAAISA